MTNDESESSKNQVNFLELVKLVKFLSEDDLDLSNHLKIKQQHTLAMIHKMTL